MSKRPRLSIIKANRRLRQPKQASSNTRTKYSPLRYRSNPTHPQQSTRVLLPQRHLPPLNKRPRLRKSHTSKPKSTKDHKQDTNTTNNQTNNGVTKATKHNLNTKTRPRKMSIQSTKYTNDTQGNPSHPTKPTTQRRHPQTTNHHGNHQTKQYQNQCTIYTTSPLQQLQESTNPHQNFLRGQPSTNHDHQTTYTSALSRHQKQRHPTKPLTNKQSKMLRQTNLSKLFTKPTPPTTRKQALQPTSTRVRPQHKHRQIYYLSK